jgi:hypothetical protein
MARRSRIMTRSSLTSSFQAREGLESNSYADRAVDSAAFWASDGINLTESANQADRTPHLHTLDWRIPQRLNPVIGKVSSAADLA